MVGRREYCDVQIDHPSLSKRHCVLVKTDGLLVIRDLATTNGTKVKGQKIRWAALLPDDRIAFGEHQVPGLPRPRRRPRPRRSWRPGRRPPAPGRRPGRRFAGARRRPQPARPRPNAAAAPGRGRTIDLPPLTSTMRAWRDALDSADRDRRATTRSSTSIEPGRPGRRRTRAGRPSPGVEAGGGPPGVGGESVGGSGGGGGGRGPRAVRRSTSLRPLRSGGDGGRAGAAG